VQCEKFGPTDADDLYDAAGNRAILAGLLAGDPGAAAVEADRAMVWLRKAVAAGYRDRANIEKDADLDALRDRPDFRALLKELEAKAAKAK
jgi:hypothetical protein